MSKDIMAAIMAKVSASPALLVELRQIVAMDLARERREEEARAQRAQRLAIWGALQKLLADIKAGAKPGTSKGTKPGKTPRAADTAHIKE